MIRASRRRTRNEVRSTDLSLHRRLARTRGRQRHLNVAAVVALVGAILGWVLGLDLLARAVLVLTSSTLTWLVPLRGDERWALEWIGARAGLAYQTALEAAAEEDRYGFRSAVEQRARESAGRIEGPNYSAWWLPILALALGALLLPSLPGLISSGSGSLGGPTGGSSATAPSPSTEEEPQQVDPEAPPDASTRVDRPPEGDDAGGRGEESEAAGADAGTEREALERFLRNIRETPESTAEGPEEESQNTAERPAGPAGDGASERRRGENDGERGEPRGGEGGEEGEREAGGPGENGEGEEGEGEEGQAPNPFAQTETGEPAEEQPGEPEDGAEGAAAEPDDEGGGQEEGAGGRRGEQDPGEDAGQGEGAGGQSSPDQAADGGERAAGEDLFLEGDLRSGPVTPGGMVQLPGAADVELPAQESPETYRRAVERAITEGRIPLEYQEIIRNYFR